MVRNQQVNNSNTSNTRLQSKSTSKSKKKQQNEFNFEDPHLAKFFQNHNSLNVNHFTNNNANTLFNNNNNNNNVVVIEDDQEDDDRTESIATTITNDTTDSSNDVYLEELPSGKFEIEINGNDTYRVGNWIYCESEPNQPYSIRRIEELKKKSDGTIEAKLRCAFRRCDLPLSLLGALEKNYSQYFTSIDQNESDSSSCFSSISSSSSTVADYLPLTSMLTSQQVYQLKQRELFYSKTIEIKSPFDVTCLRGKLDVDMFTQDINACTDYLKSNENRFFYQINYDPNQKRLSVDKIQIRVDEEKFQAELPDLLPGQPETNYQSERETLVWSGNKCKLNNAKLNKFVNDVYTKQAKTNLSHDVIMYEAIKRLHECNYDEKKAKQSFNLKRKTIKEIDSQAAHQEESVQIQKERFNEAIEKCGHDFNQIQKKYFTSNTIQQLIDYYYNVYKRTSEYIKRRELKRLRKRNDKLDLLYIPGSSMSTLCHLDKNSEPVESTLNLMCTSCSKLKIEPVKQGKQTKLNKKNLKEEKSVSLNENVCDECWNYWKKYGGFKSIQSDLNNSERISLQERVKQASANQLYKCTVDDCGREYKDKAGFRAHALIRHALVVKNFVYPRPNYLKVHNFYLRTTQLTKSARLLFNSSVHKLARNPFNKKLNLAKLVEAEWFRKPRNADDFKLKKSPSKHPNREAKKNKLERVIRKLKSKPAKSNLNESDEDLMIRPTTHILNSNSSNKKSKQSAYVEIWRPLTPISCIIGEDEERTHTTKKEKLDSTFLSPSSSVNSANSKTRTRRRLDSSSDDQNNSKKIKTNTKGSKSLLTKDHNDDDSSTSQNLSDSSDWNVENKSRKRTRSNKKPKQTKTKLASLSLNAQANSQSKLINQFETVKDKSNQNSDDCKENLSETHKTKLPIWDRFYFSANNQLRRRLKDVIYPHTLKRLSQSPFLKLKSHLYENNLSSTNDKAKLALEHQSKKTQDQAKSKRKNSKLNKCIRDLNRRNKSKHNLPSHAGVTKKKSSELNTQHNKTASLTKLNNQLETFNNNKSTECKNADEFNFCKSPYSVLDEFYF